MKPVQALTFTRHVAKRILRRKIDAAALTQKLESAVRIGLLRPDEVERRLEFGDVRVVCCGLLVITAMNTRSNGWHYRAKRLPRRKRKEPAWSE